ncbi:MAG: Asp-tRNA(Asn)/Glu-tRNA(Gln) amidotransferase subunit GatC [Patescibacteria group bacterium]
MITPEDVKRLFELAKIEVTEEELARFPKEIDAILEYIRKLQSAPLGEVSPTISFAPEDRALRVDANSVENAKRTDALRDAFPESFEHYLKVKKVFGGE